MLFFCFGLLSLEMGGAGGLGDVDGVSVRETEVNSFTSDFTPPLAALSTLSSIFLPPLLRALLINASARAAFFASSTSLTVRSNMAYTGRWSDVRRSATL